MVNKLHSLHYPDRNLNLLPCSIIVQDTQAQKPSGRWSQRSWWIDLSSKVAKHLLDHSVKVVPQVNIKGFFQLEGEKEPTGQENSFIPTCVGQCQDLHLKEPSTQLFSRTILVAMSSFIFSSGNLRWKHFLDNQSNASLQKLASTLPLFAQTTAANISAISLKNI